MSTIDELMKGKAPGEIKVTCDAIDRWFRPFYKNKEGTWFGLESTGYSVSFSNTAFAHWKIYQEPKPTKVVYEWMRLYGRSWLLAAELLTEDEAAYKLADTIYKKSGRSFEVECE